MPELKLNGKTYSGSTSYASAISYTEEDGSKTTVQDKISELAYRPVNNNLLINSNFANPVNQRGVTSITSPAFVYWIDRWVVSDNGLATYSIVDGGIQCVNTSTDRHSGILQTIEFPEQYLGKVVTLQVCIDGTIYSHTVTLPSVLEEYTNNKYITDKISIGVGINSGLLLFAHILTDANTTTGSIQWAKLELGEVTTPYVPRLYDEELQLCQRFYQLINGCKLGVCKVDTNSITFGTGITLQMRVNKPTVICDSVTFRKNSTSNDSIISGFIFTSKTGSNWITLTATKNSHGLNFTDCLSLGNDIILDAEL